MSKSKPPPARDRPRQRFCPREHGAVRFRFPDRTVQSISRPLSPSAAICSATIWRPAHSAPSFAGATPTSCSGRAASPSQAPRPSRQASIAGSTRKSSPASTPAPASCFPICERVPRPSPGSGFAPPRRITSWSSDASTIPGCGLPTGTIATASCWRPPRLPALRGSSRPVGKRARPRLARLVNQVRYPRTPSKQLLQQLLEFVFFAIQPLRGNLPKRLVHDLLRKVDYLLKPRLKIVERAYSLVHHFARIQPLQRRIAEVPVGPIENEAMIDHDRYERTLHHRLPVLHPCPEEYTLAPIRVTHPLIEHHHRQKIRQVADAAQKGVRNEVIDRQHFRVSRVPGSEMPSWCHGDSLRPEVNVYFRVGSQEVGRDPDQFRGRGGNLQVLQKNRRYQLIHQDPAVLRVVLKLDDVEIPVVRFQQVGLGPAAHLADEPAGGERHGNAVT